MQTFLPYANFAESAHVLDRALVVAGDRIVDLDVAGNQLFNEFAIGPMSRLPKRSTPVSVIR